MVGHEAGVHDRSGASLLRIETVKVVISTAADAAGSGAPPRRTQRTVSVALEFRQGGQLVIQAELPGLDPHRDIRVWIANDVLHIRASREFVAEPAEHASDLRFGTFVRDIALPPGTIEEQVAARYRGTTLEIRAPLGDERRLQRIEVPVLTLDEAP